MYKNSILQVFIKKLYSRLGLAYFNLRFTHSKRKKGKYNRELPFADIKKTFKSLNEEHAYFHHYFWHLAPAWLQEHRSYFKKERRAYGEDAFHAMWYFIFREFKPLNVLEIGIYRGSTLSLFSLLSRQFNLRSQVHGISPFSSAGDTVSKYLSDLDYYKDVLKNFEYFNLPPPHLHKGFSTDIEMKDVIRSKTWDLIFIDGNHDYEIAKSDFITCAENIGQDGLIVLDDAALDTDYRAPFYSTPGHPGPTKVAAEIDSSQFEEILSVGHNRVFKKL